MIVSLYQVTSPYYCAGIEVKGGRVRKAAPILKWAIGKEFSEMISYFDYKGYAVEEVSSDSPRT